MLSKIRSVGDAPDVNLRNPFHVGDKARKQLPWLWNPVQRSPEVQNRSISGVTKKIVLKRKEKNKSGIIRSSFYTLNTSSLIKFNDKKLTQRESSPNWEPKNESTSCSTFVLSKVQENPPFGGRLPPVLARSIHVPPLRLPTGHTGVLGSTRKDQWPGLVCTQKWPGPESWVFPSTPHPLYPSSYNLEAWLGYPILERTKNQRLRCPPPGP